MSISQIGITNWYFGSWFPWRPLCHLLCGSNSVNCFCGVPSGASAYSSPHHPVLSIHLLLHPQRSHTFWSEYLGPFAGEERINSAADITMLSRYLLSYPTSPTSSNHKMGLDASLNPITCAFIFGNVLRGECWQAPGLSKPWMPCPATSSTLPHILYFYYPTYCNPRKA